MDGCGGTEAMQKYYEAYDLRYRQVHEVGLAWFGGEPTSVIARVMAEYGIAPETPMLEIGCGEGGDAAALLAQGCNLLATDVSPEAVRFCREKYPRWASRFAVLDCLREGLGRRFGFIYAVAVLHMLVLDEDRQGLLTFIREHLSEQGLGLIVVMGDGRLQRTTDVSAAFDVQERTHGPSGRRLQIASTSCRIVTRETLREEMARAGLQVVGMGDTAWEDAPCAMYALVKRGDCHATDV